MDDWMKNYGYPECGCRPNRYEVYNKDQTMIFDRRELKVFSVNYAPPDDGLASEDSALYEFVAKLVRLLNEEEAREYTRSIP